MIPKIELVNRVSVPQFGLGMDQVTDGGQAYDSLFYALSIGYRSVDTASSYKNESAVGRAVRESGLPREEVYITTKLTAADQGYDNTLRGFDKSLKALGLNYLDCFLIHWPGKYLYIDTWKAFERLYEEKLVRVIGVCNFNRHHLEKLFNSSHIRPMVNQIEYHPYFAQRELADFCADNKILVEAWSPLMCGGVVLSDPIIISIAQETGKTPAQIVLRWHIEQGRRVFPKSVTFSRIKENADIFNFRLTDRQMQEIDSLSKRVFRIGPNPDIFFEL